MKKVPKETPLKSLSVSPLSETQRRRKLNSSIHSRVGQNEMVSIVRKLDVIYLLVEGIEKSTIVKKNKKMHKTSVPLKNLIFACFGNHEQEPSSIHWVKQIIISVLGKLSLSYGFVVLSTLNLALLGRKPKFCENTFSHLIFF